VSRAKGRAKAERDVIAAAKVWRADKARETRPSDADVAFATVVDAFLDIENAGPSTIAELDVRTLDALYNVFDGWGDHEWNRVSWRIAREKATPQQIFDVGALAFRKKPNVGPKMIEKLGSVLRANGFDVDDWRAR
jgi:hypothetical protein